MTDETRFEEWWHNNTTPSTSWGKRNAKAAALHFMQVEREAIELIAVNCSVQALLHGKLTTLIDYDRFMAAIRARSQQ